MSTAQKIGIGALPLLAVTMTVAYRLTAAFFGRKAGWYAGFLVFWPLWCIAFPIWMLGWRALIGLFRRATIRPVHWAFVLLPPVLAAAGSALATPEPASVPEYQLAIAMACVNGVLEEVLWRGLYVVLFPGDLRWGILWPALWFGLWHFAPASVSDTSPWLLVFGALLLGMAYSYVAQQTRTIRWTAASHVLAGLVRAVALRPTAG